MGRERVKRYIIIYCVVWVRGDFLLNSGLVYLYFLDDKQDIEANFVSVFEPGLPLFHLFLYFPIPPFAFLSARSLALFNVYLFLFPSCLPYFRHIRVAHAVLFVRA
jgi:hypothetical protein